jgi:hypothetical protein
MDALGGATSSKPRIAARNSVQTLNDEKCAIDRFMSFS